ncbi:MAG: hypothetical protein HOV78_05075 [Hamadaea sp.]|nr:hypothetical protein [Hamadaea sp.]
MSDQNDYGYGRDQRGPYSTPERRPFHQGGHVPPPVPVGRPAKRPASKLVIAVVSFCMLGIVGVVSCTAAMFNGAIGAANRADSAPQVAPPASEPGPPVPSTKPVEKAPTRGLRDGMLFVGKDVFPGTYSTTVPDGAVGCYWARLKDTDGELESVIANHVAMAGPISITVKKSDYAVEVRCEGAKWTKR